MPKRIQIVTKFCLVTLLVALATFGAKTAARAAPATTRTSVPAVQLASQSIPLYIDCTHVPNTPAAHKLLKAHNLCGFSGGGGVTPNGSVSGNCGTLSNWISDDPEVNVALIHVQITAVWWFGPIYSASWTGTLYNERTDIQYAYGNILIGPFGFSVDDYHLVETGAGKVDFTVLNAIDTNLVGVQCTNVAPVFDTAYIT